MNEYWGLTESTNGERDHEPCPRAYQLVRVKNGCEGEENSKDYSRCHGRLIVVETEMAHLVCQVIISCNQRVIHLDNFVTSELAAWL